MAVSRMLLPNVAGTRFAPAYACQMGGSMEQLHELSEEAVSQLQEMLNTPIEDQAAPCELMLRGNLLQNGVESLHNSESGDETIEILRQIVKSAFVIGRRHNHQLI
jgi:hypothetical protein